MGNTEVLSTFGSNGVHINPALLTDIKSLHVQVSGRMGSGSESIANESAICHYESDYPKTSRTSGFSFSNSWTHKNFYKVAYGFGQQIMHDMSFSRETTRLWSNDQESYSIVEDYKADGGIVTFCPSLAFGFGEYLSIGVSAHAAVSKSFNEDVKRTSTYNRFADGYNISYYSVNSYDGSISASCFTMAAKFKISRVNIGVVLRSRLDYRFKDIIYTTVYTGNYSEGAIEDYSYIVPALSAYAISYQLNDKIVLVGEYQTRNYSDLHKFKSGFNPSDFNDGDVRRLGLEYKAKPWLWIRGGAFREAMFLFNNGTGDPINMRGVTAGLGLAVYMFQLDLGAEYLQYNYKMELPEDYNGKIEGSRLEVGMSLSFMMDI